MNADRVAQFRRHGEWVSLGILSGHPFRRKPRPEGPPCPAAIRHPLLIIAIFVVVFLEFDPFQDGNERLSRADDPVAVADRLCLCSLQLARSAIEASKEGY